jgi:hypothetical protein
MENTLQNTYIAALVVRFGTKGLFSGGNFVQDKNGNPNSLQEDNFFLFPKLK